LNGHIWEREKFVLNLAQIFLYDIYEDQLHVFFDYLFLCDLIYLLCEH